MQSRHGRSGFQHFIFLEKSSRVAAFLISKGTEFRIWGPKYLIEFIP